MGMAIRVCRVYDGRAPEEGTWVLVDRIWPCGLAKDAARLDDWAKVVAPSTGLRTWYGHDPAKFGEFRRRYMAELAQAEPQAALALRALAVVGPLTLLTATRDVAHSHAGNRVPGRPPSPSAGFPSTRHQSRVGPKRLL